jgi:hypothetical protein
MFEQLPEDLRKMLEAKYDVGLKAVLVSYTMGGRDLVVQYRDPIFSDPSTSTSTAPEVKGNEKVDDPPPTHVDYANMLDDHKKMSGDNLCKENGPHGPFSLDFSV